MSKEDAVDRFLAECMVTYKVIYVGQGKRDNWDYDKWYVSFGAFGKPFQTMDYSTGLGHRSKTTKEPVAPRAIAPLHSLTLDSTANDLSFNDWCADLGYDNDSIKAFNTYQECCAGAKKLHAIFTREQIEQLKTLLEDY